MCLCASRVERVVLPRDAFTRHKFVSVLTLGWRKVDRDLFEGVLFLSCAKLAKLRTNHRLMGILFIVLRCTVVLILVLELVLQDPGALMVRYSF